MYEITMLGQTYEVVLVRSVYLNDGSLAVLAFSVEGDEITDYWNDVTVWVQPVESPFAYVDTNNGSSWGVEELLKKNGIAEPTGGYAGSGFCSYPLYKFNWDKIKRYEDVFKEE